LASAAWLVLMPALLPGAQAPAVHFANGYTLIDGRVVPAVPPAFGRTADSANGTYWIVQFTAPIQHRWRQRLSELGATTAGYLPQQAAVVAATEGSISRLRDEDFVVRVSRLSPVFKVAREVLDSDTAQSLAVMLFPGHAADSLARVLEGMGISVTGPAGCVLTVAGDCREAARIARLDAVQWIEPQEPARAENVDAQWVTQTGWQPAVPPESSGRRIWSLGLRGQNTVLALADAGINTEHEAFRDPLIPIRAPGIYRNHRKIIAYKLYGDAAFNNAPAWDYHGNHVASAAAGSDDLVGNRARQDGMAPDARIYWVDIYDNGGNNRVPDDLTALVDTIYLGRGTGAPVLQTSLSWGWNNGGGAYRLPSATLDGGCWRYPDLLSICAAGNNFFLVASPAAAKSALTVGATGNGIGSDTCFIPGSRGPMRDGRIKPDIAAPGIDVWSAYGPADTAYGPATGTSMSAPLVNGACALLRQYLNEGWYPTGQPEPDNALEPSSALLRAMAVVSADPNVRRLGIPRVVPDSFAGWGRMDLDSVLYFAGDRRGLNLWDDRYGLATGEVADFYVQVRNTDTIPLRAALCWTDTAGMPLAETALVNNLDLEVVGAGQSYHGNKYLDGQSPPNPPGWDSVNTIECFRRNRPVPGVWRFRVIARSVFTARQPYALVITGGVQQTGISESRRVTRPLALRMQPNPARAQLAVTWSLPEAGPIALVVHDPSGRRVRVLQAGDAPAGRHAVQWNLTDAAGGRLRPGVYFLRLEAAGRDVTRKFVIAE
jgi:hypothetical protein